MTPPTARRATLLLVTADPTRRETLSSGLAQRGHRVLTAGDTQSAQLARCQYPADIDMLLTDVMIPGVGGPALARALTARSPQLGVLFLSPHSGSALIAQGILPPGALTLSTDFEPELLCQIIHRALVPPAPPGADRETTC